MAQANEMKCPNCGYDPDLPSTAKDNPLLAMRVNAIDWGNGYNRRILGVFRNDNIFTLADLMSGSEETLLRMANFGKVSLEQVKRVLSNYGLELRKW